MFRNFWISGRGHIEKRFSLSHSASRHHATLPITVSNALLTINNNNNNISNVCWIDFLHATKEQLNHGEQNFMIIFTMQSQYDVCAICDRLLILTVFADVNGVSIRD